MGLVSVTLPNDGEDIDASDLAGPINAILAVLNGNINKDNILDGGISWAKMETTGHAQLDTLTVTSLTVSGTPTNQGWAALGQTPASVTPNTTAPRIYDLVFNAVDLSGILSPGMKLQLARTVAAPSKSTLLNGSTQYYSRASVAGMTFTDDFTLGVWIKVNAYPLAGHNGNIVTRYNGTSGWQLQINPSGQIALAGFNASGSNISYVVTYGSVPLGKWVHISAQLDMSSFTATPTTSYIMYDGLDQTAQVSRAGTNPTALIQAGALEIGSTNGGTDTFNGTIAQVAIYNAKITQAVMRASMNQGLLGTETNLISAYSFNNSVNDLNANANNLTANGAAVATNADSPFAVSVAAGSLEYAEVVNVVFSTNSTVTVRVPDTSLIPASGGVTTVNYSTQETPLAWPGIDKVIGYAEIRADFTSTSTSTFVDIQGLSVVVYIPKGRKIRVRAWGARTLTTAAQNVALGIFDGANQICEAEAQNAGAINEFTYAETIVWLSAGLHTLKASLSQGGSAGTMRFGSAPYAPAFISVEKV